MTAAGKSVPGFCTARDQESLKSGLEVVGEFLMAIVAHDWKKCDAKAVWATPLGPRCEKHALELFEAGNRGDTVLGLLLDEKTRQGVTVNKNLMRENSKRITEKDQTT